MKTQGISIRLHQVRCCNTVLLSLYIAVPKAPLNPIFNSDNYVLNFLQIFWRTWKAVCTCGKSPDKHGRLRLYFLISIWSEKKWLENISWRSKDVQLLPDLAFFSDLFLLPHIHRVIPQYHLYFCFSISLCSMCTWVSLSLPIAVRTTSLKNWKTLIPFFQGTESVIHNTAYYTIPTCKFQVGLGHMYREQCIFLLVFEK